MTLNQMRDIRRERASACINVPPILILLAGLFLPLQVLTYLSVYGTVAALVLMMVGIFRNADRALLVGGLCGLYALTAFSILLAFTNGGWLILLLAVPLASCWLLTRFVHKEINNDVDGAESHQRQRMWQETFAAEKDGRAEREKVHHRHKRLGGHHQRMTPAIALGILGLEADATLEDAQARYEHLQKTIHPDVLEKQGLHGKPLQQARKRMDKIDEAYRMVRANLA